MLLGLFTDSLLILMAMEEEASGRGISRHTVLLSNRGHRSAHLVTAVERINQKDTAYELRIEESGIGVT